MTMQEIKPSFSIISHVKHTAGQEVIRITFAVAS